MLSLSLHCKSDADAVLENVSAVPIAAALHDNRSLITLTLKQYHMSHTCVEALARMLEVNTTLSTLEITQCPMDEAHVVFFANTLKQNKSLRQLILRGGRLADEGASALADMLKFNSTLQVLNYGDRAGDDGCKKIAMALYGNTSLRKLILGNSLMTDTGASALVEMLYINNTLQMLECDEMTNVGDIGQDKLCRAVYRKRETRKAFVYFGPGNPRRDH